MIHGHIHSLDAFAFLSNHPVWRQAFEWLEQAPANLAFGTHAIRGEEMFAKVMEYDTLPREQCTFESHRRFIDLQYTIRGGEIIEWRRANELEPAGPFDEVQDLQFYRLAPAVTRIHQLPGHFGIFYPSDAHLPKIADGVHTKVFKVVIKVGLHLVSPG